MPYPYTREENKMIFCKGCKYYKNKHTIVVDHRELDKIEFLKHTYTIDANKNKGKIFVQKNCCIKKPNKISYFDWYANKSYIVYEKSNEKNKDNNCSDFNEFYFVKLFNFIKEKFHGLYSKR